MQCQWLWSKPGGDCSKERLGEIDCLWEEGKKGVHHPGRKGIKEDLGGFNTRILRPWALFKDARIEVSHLPWPAVFPKDVEVENGKRWKMRRYV